MRMQRISVALTAANLVLLALILARALPGAAPAETPRVAPAPTPTAQAVVPVLRGRALELLDDRDRVRSRIDVEPDGDVVLRLLDENGTIRVKLGAGEHGSGLLLLDDATEPGVHIIARRTATAALPATTSLTLRGPEGRQRTIAP